MQRLWVRWNADLLFKHGIVNIADNCKWMAISTSKNDSYKLIGLILFFLEKTSKTLMILSSQMVQTIIRVRTELSWVEFRLNETSECSVLGDRHIDVILLQNVLLKNVSSRSSKWSPTADLGLVLLPSIYVFRMLDIQHSIYKRRHKYSHHSIIALHSYKNYLQ